MTSASASRVTRSSRSLRLALLSFGCCLVAVTVLRAQEPPAPVAENTTAEGTESTEGAEAKTTERPPAKEGTEAVPAEAPAPAARPDRKPGVVGPTPGRFEPTEKVRADFDVSFPVDI